MNSPERTSGPLADLAAKKRLEDAAPEMLSALKAIHAELGVVSQRVFNAFSERTKDRILKAIAKAEGGQ